MAVTQQLARVAPEVLQRCRADAAMLGKLVAFELVPRQCYLDLDWAPADLEARAYAAGDLSAEAALRLCCEGARAVNPGFPKFEVYAEPTELDEREARAMSDRLAAIDFEGILRNAEPLKAADAEELRKRFRALRAFYAAASAEGQAVVVWWD
jgi:hypothetical protein